MDARGRNAIITGGGVQAITSVLNRHGLTNRHLRGVADLTLELLEPTHTKKNPQAVDLKNFNNERPYERTDLICL